MLLTSLTRAAAAELAGRETAIPKDNLGTLHSLCWRALDKRPIAETKIKDWNEAHPGLAISGEATIDDTDVPLLSSQGDKLLARYNHLRHWQVPVTGWPSQVVEFAQLWRQWKWDAEGGPLFDFTDLLEMAINNLPHAPGKPDVLMGDECQDWSRLEASVMRQWGATTESFVLVGDPDQAIYAWRGADPHIFQMPVVPDEQVLVLRQSYRVPRAVAEYADRWIRQVSDRLPIQWDGRDAEGEVSRLASYIKSPDLAIETACRELDDGRSVMILTTCSFMLAKILGQLREQGVPFGNRYRVKRGDWNPLAEHGMTAARRLLAFVEYSTKETAKMLQGWSEHCRSEGLFRRGGKARLKELEQVDQQTLRELFADEATWQAALSGDVNWYLGHLLASKVGLYIYPARVLERKGRDHLRRKPRLTVGTIHSVKGGEADVVILFPDLSLAGMRQWITPGEGRDEIVRQIYVGMTRAREKLYLCQVSSGVGVQWL